MTHKPKCWNCQHWTGDSPQEWGTCELTESKNGTHVNPGSDAVAYDTEAYYAILHTAPGFSCSQWEPKNSEEEE